MPSSSRSTSMRMPLRSLHASTGRWNTPNEPDGRGVLNERVTPMSGSVIVMTPSGLPSHSSGQRAPLTGRAGTPGSGTGWTSLMPSAAANTTPSPSICTHSSSVDIRVGPKQTPPRYDDRWVRWKRRGRDAGSDRSVCVISIAPVATSMGSPTHGPRPRPRLPSAIRSGTATSATAPFAAPSQAGAASAARRTEPAMRLQ